jgi:flagellar biosynthesis protein FlhG
MSGLVSDQADGLRRLMGRHRGRVVSVVGSSPGVGATSIVMNLAAALSQQGQPVLLLDERRGPGSATAQCGQRPRATWSVLSAGGAPLDSATGRAWGAIDVLPASVGAADPAADPRRLLPPGGIALVDAALDGRGALSALAGQADTVVVVLQPDAASIQAAYACIKALHHAHALQQLRILLTRTRDAGAAQQVAANLVRTGSDYLAVSLLQAGCVSADPCLEQAQRLGLGVVQAFQASPCAADFRRIAADLLHWPLRSPAVSGRPAAVPA